MRLSLFGWFAAPILTATLCVWPMDAHADVTFEVQYGIDQNIDSGRPGETDGWLGAAIEWKSDLGFGVGIGTDHQFDAPFDTGWNGWAIFVTGSYEHEVGPVSPFVRLGLGAGRAPCEQDTCGGGVYVRGSGGIRFYVGDIILEVEVGASRVSLPFAGLGVGYRLDL